jgi:hypothetical protein
MAEFPNAIKAFTDVTDGIDEVLATQVNQAYDEIEAIETQMITYDTGWIPTTDSWSPTSDGTITIPAGGLSIYSVGDKIRYSKNSSSDFSYGYVITIADTLITPCAGSDYSVSSSDTITDISYSKVSTPTGFPAGFNYTPTGVSATNATLTGRFSVNGRFCRCSIAIAFTGAITFTTMPTLPIPSSATMFDITGKIVSGIGSYYDSGTAFVPNGLIPALNNSATVVQILVIAGYDMSATAPITWANGDCLEITFTYEI